MVGKNWENDEYSLLMMSVRDGNAGAFEKIVNRFAKVLANYFYQLCWDRNLAEDLSQETFLKIWNSREKYRIKSSFSTYMFTIAVNLWRDEKRKKSSKLIIIDKKLHDSEKEQSTLVQDGVEQKSENKILSENMKKIIDELDDKHKQPFVMSEISGMTYEQIATVLKIPVGTVRSRKFNAFRKLKERLMILIETMR